MNHPLPWLLGFMVESSHPKFYSPPEFPLSRLVWHEPGTPSPELYRTQFLGSPLRQLVGYDAKIRQDPQGHASHPWKAWGSLADCDANAHGYS